LGKSSKYVYADLHSSGFDGTLTYKNGI